MNVKFKDVGRGKKCFDVTMPELEYDSLYKAVKKAGALGSRDIEFMFDHDTNQGTVVVGGFRQVGTFSCHEESA